MVAPTFTTRTGAKNDRTKERNCTGELGICRGRRTSYGQHGMGAGASRRGGEAANHGRAGRGRAAASGPATAGADASGTAGRRGSRGASTRGHDGRDRDDDRRAGAGLQEDQRRRRDARRHRVRQHGDRAGSTTPASTRSTSSRASRATSPDVRLAGEFPGRHPDGRACRGQQRLGRRRGQRIGAGPDREVRAGRGLSPVGRPHAGPSDRSNFSGPWFMSPWKYPGLYPRRSRLVRSGRSRGRRAVTTAPRSGASSWAPSSSTTRASST